MACSNHHHFPLFFLPLLFLLQTNVLSFNMSMNEDIANPLSCNNSIHVCTSYLYRKAANFSVEQIASFYMVNTSNIKPISRGHKQDYLVSVPCTCKDVNGTKGYFYDTLYRAQAGDTLENINAEIYDGQAWNIAGRDEKLVAGSMVSTHLLCGCTAENSLETMLTYTVQLRDTLFEIAALLSANLSRIQSYNERLAHDPNYIEAGWVLFIPQLKEGIKAPNQEADLIAFSKPGKRRNLTVILIILSAVTVFSVCTLILLLLIRKRNNKRRGDNSNAVSKWPNPLRTSLQYQNQKKDLEDATFESDKPVIYDLEEIAEAAGDFHESRKVGEGGYGSVYFGILKEQEVAIKKMKSCRSKEFYAELKVLCKIHHINVLELLGYASGDDHLYLVYEYMQNGSLSDHLHDPLLKGHSPLSWTARAHIALDAARGIEYIHDHTKTRYVHRDIKTSNILLDQGLKAKVADFGLARLVERTNEEDLIVTCLVGTPGYIAPESVRMLHMTSKSDVFAFGVVLAELVTGKRALSRDKKEPRKLETLALAIFTIFEDEDPVTALMAKIDVNLRGNYPLEEVYKMAEISRWCLNDDPVDRPEMREIVPLLSGIMLSSIEWEASLGDSSQIFSTLMDGR